MSEPKPTAPATVKAVYPAVYDSFMAMRGVLSKAGPLDTRTLELILLSGFTVARQESGFKVHCKRALELGASADDVRHAVVINVSATCAIEPVGEALMWIDDVLAAMPSSA